jgi:hypothetical protein
MIKSLTKLHGLPGAGNLPIRNYSPDGKSEFREGVAIQFTDERGQQWIGNFQTSGDVPAHLFNSGVAVVLAGPHCYIVKDAKTTSPQIFSSCCAGSVWKNAQPFVSRGRSYLVIGGSDGALLTLDDQGNEVASSHLPGPCEDVRFGGIDTSLILKGHYFEPNLKKDLTFALQLPELKEIR